MKEQGQIFSLDFLVSIAAIVLAIGLSLQAMEIKSVAAKEAAIKEDIRIVAETAAELLVTNPEIVCNVKADTGAPETLFSINNCISNSLQLTKAAIGIPNGYNCKVSGITLASNECQGTAGADAKNVVVATRVVSNPALLPGEKVLKSRFDQCAKSGCNDFAKKTVTIMVWK